MGTNLTALLHFDWIFKKIGIKYFFPKKIDKMKKYIICAEAAQLLQQSSFSKKWKTMQEQPRNSQFFVRSFITIIGSFNFWNNQNQRFFLWYLLKNQNRHLFDFKILNKWNQWFFDVNFFFKNWNHGSLTNSNTSTTLLQNPIPFYAPMWHSPIFLIT
jgi:hypothetical protein